MFIGTVSYVTDKGYKKTLQFSSKKESEVNYWLNTKCDQLNRLNCTNVICSYTVV